MLSLRLAAARAAPSEACGGGLFLTDNARSFSIINTGFMSAFQDFCADERLPEQLRGTSRDRPGRDSASHTASKWRKVSPGSAPRAHVPASDYQVRRRCSRRCACRRAVPPRARHPAACPC